MNRMRRLIASFLALTVAMAWSASGLADDRARPAAGLADSANGQRGRTELVAAIPESFPPDYQLDKNGRPIGLAIEVMDAVAALAGFTVRYRVEKDWVGVQAAIRNGDADVIPNMGITEKRGEDFIYTRPVETINVALFVLKSNDDIAGISNLPGRVAGSVEKNVGVALLSAVPGVQVRVFESLSKALFALIDEAIVALAYPEPIVWRIADELNLYDRIKTVGPPLATVERAIAMRKNNVELRALLDIAVASYMETPAYRETYRKWHVEPASFWTVERFVVLSGAIVAALLTFVGFRLVRSQRFMAAIRDWRHGGILDPGARARLMILVLVLPLAVFAAFAATLATLYGTSFNEQRDRLQDTARIQARLIEAMADFDTAHNFAYPGGAEAATIAKIADGLRRHKGASEILLAKRRGDKMEFIVRQHAPTAYAQMSIAFAGNRAEPMRRALLGQSGTMIGRDYDGVMVLAAYESINSFGLGLVTKMGLADIRAPFIRAGLIAALIAAAIAGAGTLFTFGVFNTIAASIRGIGERFRSLLEAHTDLVCRYAPNGTLRYVNGAYCRFLGQTAPAILGTSVFDAVPADRRDGVKDRLAALTPDSRSFAVEYPADIAGKTRWLQWTHTALFDEKGDVAELIGIGRDVTERKQAEEAVKKSNRAFKTLSACNTALIRINSEDELFTVLCRTIVDIGGYRMAWIGLKRPDAEKTIEPVARAGHSDGYVENLRVSWADVDRGRGPTGTAVRTGNPIVTQDIATSPNFGLWRAEAEKRGYRSSASFPLLVEGEVIGTLNVYATEINAFDAEETALLTELTQDISFGLATLRQRERRRLAEEASRKSATRLGGAIQSMQEGFALFDAEDRLVAFNDTYRQINPYADEALEKGATFEETLRKNIEKGVIPEAVGRAEDFLRERLAQHRDPGAPIVRRFKDGRTYMMREARTPEGGIALSLADVSELRRKEDALIESEARFRAVLDSSPAAIVLKDRQGCYLLANDTFRAWTKIGDRDLAGLTPLDVFPKEVADEIAAADEKAFASGKAEISEGKRTFADGIARDVIVHRCPVFSASGDVAAISITVTDISGVKAAEQQVRESDLRLRGAIEGMQEGFVLYDADDRLVAINEVYRNMSPDAAAHLANHARFEDVLRSNVAKGWIADAKGPSDEKFIQERLAQHRHPRDPIVRQVGNGQWHLIKETRTPDGGTALTFTNITELKRAEQRLLESERRFQDFADSTSDWFWELDEELRFSYFSERHGAPSAFPAVRMMGQRPWEVPDIDSVKNGHWNLHRDILEARQPFRDFEVRSVAKDGRESFAAVSGKPVFDAAGNFRGYRGTATDITARKKAERNLRKLSQAVEQSPAAIIIADAGGTIEYINAKFTEVTGYSAAEAIGKNPRMLKSGETPAGVYEEMWATVKAGKEWRGVLRNRRKDGTVYMSGTTIAPILGPDGKIVNLIGSQQDITQRLEAEARLKHAERIQALGGLAGGIAHEFNNMLLPILTLSDMARKSMPADSRDRLRLDKVIEAARRAQDLVGRILMFSRQEETTPEPIDICECVRHSLGLIYSTLPTTVKIVENLDTKTGTIVADRTQIETVIMNLAVNAADAMEGKVGEIAFSLEPEDVGAGTSHEISGLRPGRYAKITVADTGCGMDEQTLSRAMEPFFTTKPVGKGTGLGLAMVHGIVSKSGGAINISSTPGVGTRVVLYLPIQSAKTLH